MQSGWGGVHISALTLNKGPSVSFPLWLDKPGLTPLRGRPTQPAAPTPLDTLPHAQTVHHPTDRHHSVWVGEHPALCCPAGVSCLCLISPATGTFRERPHGAFSIVILKVALVCSSVYFAIIHCVHHWKQEGEQKQTWPLPLGS